MYNKTYVEYGELWHHGILGQKWGIRRFQNPDGTWTDRGKRMRRAEDASAAKEKASKEKAAAKAAKKKASADKAMQKKIQRIRNEKVKAEQDRIHKAKTGDLKTIQEMQRKGQLSNQELQEAINRLRLQNQLNDLAPKKKTGWDKLNDLRGKAETVANALNTGKRVIDSINSIRELAKSKEPTAVDLLQKKGKDLVNQDILDMADKLSSKDLQDMLRRTDNLNSLWKNERGSGSGKSGGKGGGKGGNKDNDYYDIIDRLEALENK